MDFVGSNYCLIKNKKNRLSWYFYICEAFFLAFPKTLFYNYNYVTYKYIL